MSVTELIKGVKSKKVDCDSCHNKFPFKKLKKISESTRYCEDCYYEELNKRGRKNNTKRK